MVRIDKLVTLQWEAGIDFYWHPGPAINAARRQSHVTGKKHRAVVAALLPGDAETVLWEAGDADLVKPTKIPAGFDVKAAVAEAFNLGGA